MTEAPIIAGAGMSGCIAAYILPRASILEAAPPDGLSFHRAVLRFRSDEVSKVTGIPFRRVTVRKGIFYQGEFVTPTPRLANFYSQKVINRIIDRSVWDVEPVKRYVAPPDFHQRMLDHLDPRISYNAPFDFTEGGTVISTVPLPATLGALGIQSDIEFGHSEIHVVRGEVLEADVFQSVYFPGWDTPLYRLSITGNQVIAEFTKLHLFEDTDLIRETYKALDEALGIHPLRARLEKQPTTQKHGKIAPIPDAARKNIIHKLTLDHGIYSLGRFATWRNILLDDVVSDVAAIRQLLEMDSYDRRLR